MICILMETRVICLVIILMRRRHLSGLRDALRQHICGEAALELHSDDSP